MELTKEIENTIVIMYSQGYTTGEIAAYFGIPEVEVVRLVHPEY